MEEAKMELMRTAKCPDNQVSNHQPLLASLLGLGVELQMAREKWRSIRGTRERP